MEVQDQLGIFIGNISASGEKEKEGAKSRYQQVTHIFWKEIRSSFRGLWSPLPPKDIILAPFSLVSFLFLPLLHDPYSPTTDDGSTRLSNPRFLRRSSRQVSIPLLHLALVLALQRMKLFQNDIAARQNSFLIFLLFNSSVLPLLPIDSQREYNLRNLKTTTFLQRERKSKANDSQKSKGLVLSFPREKKLTLCHIFSSTLFWISFMPNRQLFNTFEKW